MGNLQPIEYNSQRILTTAQIAAAYGTDARIISNNFTRNKDRYTPGKHYFCLEGADLKVFRTSHQFDDQFIDSRTPKLYLWTEKGALLHAKSLNTDKAWEAYELLVDEYYRMVVLLGDTQEQPVVRRVYPWTEEAERLRQINMKAIQPGYFTSSAFVLQKLIYVDLGKMTPDERAKIDISFGKFFPRWLKGDRSGQLKGCPISPEHPYDASLIQQIGQVVDSETGREYPVYHYANIYAGDRDTFWDLWYAPRILPVYFKGKLPDGLPRMMMQEPELPAEDDVRAAFPAISGGVEQAYVRDIVVRSS